MRRLAWLLLLLPACGPYGIPGDYEQAGFTTHTYCTFGCDHVRGFAVDGDYRIGVELLPEACPSTPWTVVADGADIDSAVHGLEGGEPACVGSVALHATEVGSFRLTAQTIDGAIIDTIGLRVAEPDFLSVTYALADGWTPRDAAAMTLPHGVLVDLAPLAMANDQLIAIDDATVTWVYEGAVERAPDPAFGSFPGRLYAARVGAGRVRLTSSRGLEATLEVEVRPMAEGDAGSRACYFSHEICDGLDNDCDGAIDEPDAGCE
ncbi:MAG: putative metal-binding motif-containing protein [Myxococcales bacterium]|nr:putative metal-binding motif-containing protein [Myxococcales bacterium]